MVYSRCWDCAGRAGIYSVVAYSVAERTAEIGIRIALGAEPRHVFKLILSQALLWVSSGMAIGLTGAYALARALTGLISGIELSDPIAFGGVALTLSLVAMVAASLPVFRAMQINAVEALRHE